MFIYKNYDQAALDHQYNNRARVPEHAEYTERWQRMSDEAEQIHKGILDIAYGEHERERLDIYPSPVPQSKTLVFIHGGYWQRFDKSMFRFVVNGFRQYNLTIALVNYPLAPAAKMDQIVQSCRKAMSWLNQNIQKYNGVESELYIIGHSAGGHLATMMIIKDENNFLPEGIIKAVCAMSGLFNLLPIQLSDQNLGLHLSNDDTRRNSPVHYQPFFSCPLVLAVGEDESEEFIEQSEELNERWAGKMVELEYMKLNRINHYSILEHSIDRNTYLHHAIKRSIGIK